MKSIDYRPNIDGLRAIAVIMVILFHARVPGFGGGFIGVDIFFVISGYLITSLVLKETEAGVFSFKSFYLRRTRRIFPALLCVVAITLPFAWYLMLPNQLLGYFNSVISTILFYSNYYFWLDSNYFGMGAEYRPLIHTWSLAIEEQFYILFPFLFFIVIKKFYRQALAISVCFLLASLFYHIGAV